jgi:hypothetical protein
VSPWSPLGPEGPLDPFHPYTSIVIVIKSGWKIQILHFASE